jgi:hypothetical protein
MKLAKAVVTCCAILTVAASEARAATEWMMQAGIEDFRWREFEGGTRLLEESGTRYSLGIGLESPMSPDSLTVFNAEGKLYFGTVDYDGQACNVLTGVCVPSASETDYDGIMAEASVSRRYPKDQGGAFEVFGAVGIDSWTREIKSTAFASGGWEDWTVFYGRAGAGWRTGAYALRAGVKLPLAVDEATDLGIDLEPKGRASLFLGFMATVHDSPRQSWSINAFYDSYRFAESDHVLVWTNLGLLEVWQPESHQDVLGLQLTGHWR